MADAIEGLVIDRSLITHGESTDQMFAAAKIQKMNKDLEAGKDVDFEEMRRLLDSIDALNAKVVTALPAGWLPEGVTLATDSWIHKLAQTNYEALSEAARPAQPGDTQKKD